MKQIEKFMLPEHTNTLYEKEAISSISLTKEVASKINEIVETINQLSQVDLEWKQTQEGTIRKGVLFMKDNLVNSLNDLMKLLVDNGFIEQRIHSFTDLLASRVENLLNQIVPGTTSMDAEVIDIRTDNSGKRHSSAGNSVREQCNAIIEMLQLLGTATKTRIPLSTTITPGYLVGTELRAQHADRLEVTTGYIAFDRSKILRVNIETDAGASTAWARVSIFNENMEYVQSVDLSGTTGKNNISWTSNNVNGNYVRISYHSFGNAKTKIEYVSGDELTREFPYYRNQSLVNCLNLKDWEIGYIQSNGEILGYNSKIYQNNFTSGFTPVRAETAYKVFYDTHNPYVTAVGDDPYATWCCVACYDSNKQFLQRFNFPNAEVSPDQWYSHEYDFITPAGTAYIRGCARAYDDATFFIGEVIEQSANAVTANYNVKGVAHRGLSGHAPENTIPAYKRAKQFGFQYVECDIQVTSDGVPILFHDAEMSAKTSGVVTGSVSDHTYEEIKSVDVGSWFSPVYAGTVIPTLDEFMKYCRNAGLTPYLEVKNSVNVSHVPTLISIVRKYGMESKVTWIGAHIEEIAKLSPNARYGYVAYTPSASLINGIVEKRKSGLDFFINSNDTSDASVNSAMEAGIPYEVWIINTEEAIINLNPYISGVTSDHFHAGKVLENHVV